MTKEYIDDWLDSAYTSMPTGITSQQSASSWIVSQPSVGMALTSSGTNGTGWVTTGVSVDTSLKGTSLSVKGNAAFEGDVTIKGKSIADSLERIEGRLAILRPNEELEEKWENLRGLRKMYMELEAEIIEKEKVWAILQK